MSKSKKLTDLVARTRTLIGRGTAGVELRSDDSKTARELATLSREDNSRFWRVVEQCEGSVTDVIALGSLVGQVAAAQEEVDDQPLTVSQKLLKLADGCPIWRNVSQPWLTFSERTEASDRLIQKHAPIRSTSIKNWLRNQFREVYGRPASSAGMEEAISDLEARAQTAPEHEVSIRSGLHDGAIWLDLARPDGTKVRITPSGWTIEQSCPIWFGQPRAMKPLPIPLRDGSLEPFRELLSLDGEGWELVAAWLVFSLWPSGPFPVLVFTGPPGSGKSTRARLIRSLVDPHEADLRYPPSKVSALLIGCANTRILAIDNLSFVTTEMSDALCRIATGGAGAQRELYTDGDEVITRVCNPVILTGIPPHLVSHHDLADRAVFVPLPRWDDAKRLTEAKLRQRFDEIHPTALGAVCDRLSLALRTLPRVELPAQTRMLDFAVVAIAGEGATSQADSRFWGAYLGSKDDAVSNALENCPFSEALARLVRDAGGTWNGSASGLLNDLCRLVPEDERTKAWPKAANVLTGKLSMLVEALHEVGIEYEHTRSARRRMITLRLREGVTSGGNEQEPDIWPAAGAGDTDN